MEWLLLLYIFLWIYALGKNSKQQFHLDAKLADMHTLSNLMQRALCILEESKDPPFLINLNYYRTSVSVTLSVLEPPGLFQVPVSFA